MFRGMKRKCMHNQTLCTLTTQSKIQPHSSSSKLPLTCHTSCHSVSEPAGRGKEAIKLWSASFPSLWHISLSTGLFCTLSRQQRDEEEADGKGHLNKPSVEPGSRDNQAQPDLWPSTILFPHWGPSLELLDVLFPVYYFLSPLSTSPSSPFPVPHSQFSFFMSVVYLPLFLILGVSYHPLPFLPDILASCSLRQGVYSSPCKLSCSSRGMSHSLQRGDLSQHLCLLSSQHPWPEHDLDSTTTCFLQNHPHTLHRGCLLEVLLQKTSKQYAVPSRGTWYNLNAFCIWKLHKIKHFFEGAPFTVQ